MKKQLFLALLCLCTISSIAQTFKGVVRNAETNAPAGQITIVSADQTFFVTSNDQGEVVLPENMVNKKLFINDYEYQYSEKAFTNTQDFVWELTPNSETLEEIVIYENPEMILEEVINHSIESFSSNLKLESYYRENYYENNQTARFADGIVDFYVNRALNKVQPVVKQSRAKGIAEISEVSESLMGSPSKLVDFAMQFNRLSKLIEDKRHEFYITSKTIGDKTIYTCYINPKEKSRRGMMNFLFKGYFRFDAEKKLILETNLGFAPEKKKYNNKPVNMIIAKITVWDYLIKAKYNVTDNLYYPTYAQWLFKGNVNSKLAKVDNEQVHSQSYFYVLSANKVLEMPAENKVHSGNLYSRGSIYKEEFWKRPEIINLEE